MGKPCPCHRCVPLSSAQTTWRLFSSVYRYFTDVSSVPSVHLGEFTVWGMKECGWEEYVFCRVQDVNHTHTKDTWCFQQEELPAKGSLGGPFIHGALRWPLPDVALRRPAVTPLRALPFALRAPSLFFHQGLRCARLRLSAGIWTSTCASLGCDFPFIHLLSAWPLASGEASSELHVLCALRFVFRGHVTVDLQVGVGWFAVSFPH